MSFVHIVLSVLAVWRVTHLVTEEDGPLNISRQLRRLGRPFSCFLCASVWIAVPFALLLTTRWRELALLIPGLSGGAILLERSTRPWFDEKR